MDKGGNIGAIFVIFVTLSQVVTGKFLSYEDLPNPDDPCTMTFNSLNATYMNHYVPDPACLKGGFIWYWNKARLHLQLSVSQKKDQEFLMCLESGLLDSVYIFWDSHDDYWSPIGFPNWAHHLYERERCRPSTDGVVDLIFEPPWAVASYVTWVSWTLKPVDDLDKATDFPEDEAWDEVMRELGEPGFDRDDQEYY